MTVAHIRPDMSQEEAAQAVAENLFMSRVKDASWLDRQEFPPLEWCVDGILPEGYALLVAPPKAGKSWLVANIGLACATGGMALGGIEVQQRPVLYLALEDGDRRLQTRFRTIMEDTKLPSLMHRVLDVNGLLEATIIAEEFQDRMRLEHPNMAPPLVIVDTLARVSPDRKMSESQYQADYALGAKLQDLAKRSPGSTVLAVHHTNKGEHADFMSSVSGTQGVTGACDAVLALKRARKSDDAVLSVTGRDIANETEYALNADGGRWSLIGNSLSSAEAAVDQVKQDQADAAISAKYGDRTSAVLQAVNNTRDSEGEGITPKEVAESLDIDLRQAGNILARLHKSGQVAKPSRGRYAPVESTGWIVQDSNRPAL